MRTPLRCEVRPTGITTTDVKKESRVTPGSECHYTAALTEAGRTGGEIGIATNKLISTLVL